MTSSVMHRRRSERYAQLLDEASGVRRHHARSSVDDELNDLVELSHRLTVATPEVTVRPEFRSDTRAFLMAVAQRDGIGRTAAAEPAVGRARVAPGRASVSARIGATSLFRPKAAAGRITTGRGRARGAILVGLAVGTLALSGISAASGDAKPGDTLYGMKRQAESAQIALASGDEKGNLYLQYAHQRLTEARSVDPTSKSFGSTLDTMDGETQAGVKILLTSAVKHRDAIALTSVQQFVTAQQSQLAQLAQGLPQGSARDRVEETSRLLLDRIGIQSKEIRSDLGCASMTIVRTDATGPHVTCQESAQSTPTTTPKSGNGKSVPTKPGGRVSTPKVAPTVATAPTTTQAAAPANTNDTVARTSTPTADGGLLGSVEHLLGRL